MDGLSGGFFGGAAEGFLQGMQEARARKQQAFDNQLRAEASQRAQKDADYQNAMRAGDAIDREIDMVNRQAASDPNLETNQQQYQSHLSDLNRAKQRVYQHIGAPILSDSMQQAQQTFQDLHTGAKTVNDMPPDQLSESMTHMLGINAQELADPKSAYVQAAKDIHDYAQSGDTSKLIPALNVAARGELEAYQGAKAYDGSTIDNAQIEGIHPNPGNPQQATIAVRFHTSRTGPTGDVQQGTFVRPLMLKDGHLALHPDQLQDAQVMSVDTADALHKLIGWSNGVLATQHPDVQAKLQQASPEQFDRNAFLSRLAILGGGATNYGAPKVTVEKGAIITQDPVTGRVSVQRLPYSGMAGLEDEYANALAEGDTGKAGALQQAIAAGKGLSGLKSPDDPVRIAEIRALAAGGAQQAKGWQPILDQAGNIKGRFNTATGEFSPVSGVPEGLHLAPKGGVTTGQLLDPGAIEDAARTWMSGVPPTGFGRSPATLAAIANKKAELERANGDDAAAAATQQVAAKATQRALADLTQRETFLEANTRTAENNFKTIEKLSSKVDRTGSPIINQLKQAFQTTVVQDPDLAALKNAISEGATEYAKVVTGQTTGAAVTDTANKQVQKLLSATDSPKAFAAELATMREFIGNRRQGFRDEKQAVLDSLKPQAAVGLSGSTMPAAAPHYRYDAQGNRIQQ